MPSADDGARSALRRNRLLNALSEATLADLSGRAEIVPLELRQHLLMPDEPIDAV